MVRPNDNNQKFKGGTIKIAEIGLLIQVMLESRVDQKNRLFHARKIILLVC
tara:strand:+ start:674 stop:826 length:153 start_codon:yes stop_codon:yes gene_type:complete